MDTIPQKFTGNTVVVEKESSISMNWQIFIAPDAHMKVIFLNGALNAPMKDMIFVLLQQQALARS